jgi:hypothetical protein
LTSCVRVPASADALENGCQIANWNTFAQEILQDSLDLAASGVGSLRCVDDSLQVDPEVREIPVDPEVEALRLMISASDAEGRLIAK